MMMATRVLVAYATRYGSTREAAEVIAQVLREHGLETETKQVREVRSLEGYSAVILGAALYMGHWHRDACAFLKRHHKALLHLPVAIFALGPLSTAEKEMQNSRAQLDRVLAKFYWLTPVAVGMFGGVIDPARLRFPFNRMPKSDARDWTAIRAFAGVLVPSFWPARLKMRTEESVLSSNG